MSVLESILAKQWGVTRKQLRDYRKKIGGWEKKPAGIMWTESGLRDLERLMNGEGFTGPGQGVGSHKQPEGPTEASTVVTDARMKDKPARVRLRQNELVVVRIYTKNRRLLLAHDRDGSEQRVRVRNNEFFVAGQIIPCIWQNSNLWTLNGRCPKAKGKLYKKVKR